MIRDERAWFGLAERTLIDLMGSDVEERRMMISYENLSVRDLDV